MPFKDPNRAREYQKNYQAQWHQDHKVERLARLAERKAEVYWYVQDLKKTLRCESCGFKHPAALQFHHRNREEKLFIISSVMKMKYSLDKVDAEIRKCVVLCANCHAIHHWKERRRDQPVQGPSIAEQIDKTEQVCMFTRQEEAAFQLYFGDSQDPEQQQRHYLEFYGVDPKNIK